MMRWNTAAFHGGVLRRTALLVAAAAFAFPAPAQEQPIEFPHNRHVALGLECIDCHITVDTRDAAGMPSVRKCMLCHEKLVTGLPGVQKVREYAEKGREIPWVRVYRFNREGHVKFRHASHARAGIECAVCHGEVSKMTVVKAEVKHTMGTCLSCHRENRASEDCIACHF